MAGPTGEPIGLSYPRLVPATLLPPEDPSHRAAGRTLRDWFVDSLLFLLAIGFGVVFFAGTMHDRVGPSPAWLGVTDVALGVVSSLLLWGRRRWPVAIAVLTAAASIVSATAAAASVVGFFTVAVHRRTSVAIATVVVNLATAALFTVVRPTTSAFWFSMVISLAVAAVVTAWGMFVRARRQLVWTLRERAERAEAEQRLLADRARDAERGRIAREMHDVLGHRISLLALHAGGLQMRPDLPTEQVRQTAGLLRETAQQALQELRGVVGVLREGLHGTTGQDDAGARATDAPAPPQPMLRDVVTLVDESRRAGAKVRLELELTTDEEPPGSLGRDAYRIVQESLTNVAKHATGTATSVRLAGGPGDGLHVLVRNRMPVASTPSLPGAGTGLLGLRERVGLSGGTLRHGPDGAGDFVVDAKLAW